MLRFQFQNTDIPKAVKILKKNDIPYEYTTYDAIIIDVTFADKATNAWQKADIEYSEI